MFGKTMKCGTDWLAAAGRALPAAVGVLCLLLAAGSLAAQSPPWQLVHYSGAEWSPRVGHAAVQFNNRLWITGGGGEVWSSTNGINWTLETVVPWPGRIRHTAVVYNNRIWVMGGRDGATNLNDVWSSADGINWTLETAAAQWTGRQYHLSLVFDNKMWVMGGDGGSPLFDVWSSTNGTTWTLETAAAQWPGRQRHAGVVFNNKMWVFGGRDLTSELNDVWSSPDGITWTLEAWPAGWAPRMYHAAVVFNNKMLVMGGYDGSNDLGDVWSSTNGINWVQEAATAQWSARSYLPVLEFNSKLLVLGGGQGVNSSAAAKWNDIWSSTDAITWTEETPPVQWAARSDHATATFDNKLWVLGGNAGSNPGLNDVWCSPDGINWTQTTAAAAWPARKNHAAVAFDNKLWVMGGSGRNDVWSSPDGINWTEAPINGARWGGREDFGLVAYDNKMWVLDGDRLGDVWWSDDGSIWHNVPATGPRWQKRRRHDATVFDNKMWVMGGQDGGSTVFNDAWWSTDGATWTQATGNAQWTPRERIRIEGFDGKLWVVGGNIGSAVNDVWSSPDGITWTLEMASAEWEARTRHETAVFDNRLWVIGGEATVRRDDAWAWASQVAPQVAGTAPATAIAGQPYTYTFAATGLPSPTVAVNGLPSWLTYDNVNTISGTPQEAHIGMTAPITITATNSAGTDDQVFQIDVQGEPPLITTATLPAATSGMPYSFTIVATGIPVPSFSASGLPSWLSLNTATGELTGTPSDSDIGLSPAFSITADNTWAPADTQQFDIQVNGVAPVITSTPPVAATVGSAYEYTIVGTGNPTPAFTVSGLPGWLTFDNVDTISGTPPGAAIGMTGTITVTASNGWAPDDTQTFQIDVSGVAPSFTSTPVVTATPKSLYTYTAVATGTPAPTLSVTSALPAWLSFNAVTGELSGTPGNSNAKTTVMVTIQATNTVAPDAMQTFTIQVARSPDAEKSDNEDDGCAASAARGRPWLASLTVLALLALAARSRLRRSARPGWPRH